ncbi:MAG: response regulator [Spirochaetales bacterium]|nr:response regulator [Spirochaetales bacterium]
MSRPETILVTDDDPRIRETITEMLNLEGYRTLQAESGAQALDILACDEVDVVLLDINMEVMDGLETTRRIKSDPSLRNIPVVIVSGMDDSESRIAALQMGADDFLNKPPHLAELKARVRSLVKVKAYHDYMLNYQKKLEDTVGERTRELRNTLEELALANRKLKTSSLSTIYCLSRAAEYRDEDTSTHLQRMSHYSATLAEKTGIPEADREMLLYTTPMHDIGKIGIPDSILRKTGKLLPREWLLMQEHTIIGAKILEGSSDEFLVKARTIALTHHEKWDGTGYPRGLKGEEIPVEGRITAVADVFDALTTKRPYKDAFPTDRAFRIILEGRGFHFDPALVDAFLSVKDEILRTKERFSEVPDIFDERGETGAKLHADR